LVKGPLTRCDDNHDIAFTGPLDMTVSPASSDEPADLGPSRPENARCNLPVPLAAVRVEATQESVDPDAPRIELLTFDLRGEEALSAKSGPARASTDWRRIAAAVSLTAVVTIGVAAAAMHVGETRVATAQSGTAHALSDRLDAMSARLESLDANRTHDEVANFRKVLAEIKNSVAGARNVSDGVTQLNARVDRLEKEQGGKFDKLGDRIDRDAASRLADIAGRLDKLEAKASDIAEKTGLNVTDYCPAGGLENEIGDIARHSVKPYGI